MFRLTTYPLGEAHSTAGAMFSRLEASEDGGVTFDAGAQHDRATDALIAAHNLILNTIDLQKEHFKLQQLEEPLKQCIQDFMDIWKG